MMIMSIANRRGQQNQKSHARPFVENRNRPPEGQTVQTAPASSFPNQRNDHQRTRTDITRLAADFELTLPDPSKSNTTAMPRRQPVIDFDAEPALDAVLAAALKVHQERLEREKQPVPPKPREVLPILPSGRVDRLRPSRGWRSYLRE